MLRTKHYCAKRIGAKLHVGSGSKRAKHSRVLQIVPSLASLCKAQIPASRVHAVKHITKIYEEACENAQTKSSQMVDRSDEKVIFTRLDEEVTTIITDLDNEAEDESQRITMETIAAIKEAVDRITAAADVKQDKVRARHKFKLEELAAEGGKGWQRVQAATQFRFVRS